MNPCRYLLRSVATSGLLAAVLLGRPAPASAKGTKQITHTIDQLKKRVAADLVDAAAGVGVKLDARSVSTIHANGAGAVLGAVDGLGAVPESAIPKGVNVAYGYFDFPQGKGGSPLPPGFYTIRFTATQASLDASYKQFNGTVPDPSSLDERVDTAPNATADFVNEKGVVVYSLPAGVDVWARGGRPDARHVLTTIEPVGFARGFGAWVVTNGGLTWCFTCPWLQDG